METTSQPPASGEPAMAHAAHSQSLYALLEALPDGVTGEVLNGQLHTQPRPAARHAVAASRLGAHLSTAFDSRGRESNDWWLIDEPELHFVRNVEVLVPDIAGWRRERMPELPDDQRFEIVPDFVCEVLSPSTRSKDREIKMPLYAKRGVRHAWLVDPESETLEAFALEQGAWVSLGRFGAADQVAVEPFPEARLRVGELWA